MANADRLIGGFSTAVYRFVGGICHLEAFTPINPAADEMMRARFPRPIAGMWHFERAHAGEIVEFADTETEAAALPLREIARARGFRSVLYVPLMSKGTAIGVIVVSRRNPGSFSAHHVELLRTFADQAVIAIENVRLFNEYSRGGAGAADRDGGHPEGHRPLARTWSRCSRPLLENAMRLFARRIMRRVLPMGRRIFQSRRAYGVPPAWAACLKGRSIRDP